MVSVANSALRFPAGAPLPAFQAPPGAPMIAAPGGLPRNHPASLCVSVQLAVPVAGASGSAMVILGE